SFNNVMRLFSVKQLQVQVAPGLVSKPLKEFFRQPKTKARRHILRPFSRRDSPLALVAQPAPNQKRPPAEINHATRQAFVHRHVSLARQRVSRIKPGSVPADALLISQRLEKELSQH